MMFDIMMFENRMIERCLIKSNTKERNKLEKMNDK